MVSAVPYSLVSKWISGAWEYNNVVYQNLYEFRRQKTFNLYYTAVCWGVLNMSIMSIIKCPNGCCITPLIIHQPVIGEIMDILLQ